MPSEAYKFVNPAKTQSDGAQSLPASGLHKTHQLSVSGGTSGTLAATYTVGDATYTLKDSDGNAIVIDLANNTTPYIFDGLIDAVVLTPTTVVGNYVAELRGIS